MEKQKIDLPGAEALARPRTRGDFLKVLAAASAGAAVGSTVLSRKAFAQTEPLKTDVDIANFALTLELLEATFYEKALDSGVLSGDALGVIRNLAKHENLHVDVLTAFIQSEGGTPVEPPQFTFPPNAFASTSSILELAISFEPVGVGAYIGAASAIQSPVVLELAGSIAGVEGEHVTAIQNLLGVVPPANEAFADPLTQDQVLNAVAPFLGMGAMMDTGGPEPSGSTTRGL